jgi:Trypsin-like peptidase domain
VLCGARSVWCWLACFLLCTPAFADGLQERLVRIEALDANDGVKGCGAGYLTRSARIITAYHVLVPPNSSLCGAPEGQQTNITKLRITRHNQAPVVVDCGYFELVPALRGDSRRPKVDVGFLKIDQSQSALLQVPDEPLDGFVDDAEFEAEASGTVFGYLDDQCRRPDAAPAVPQHVVLGSPRTVKNPKTQQDGEYIVVDHPFKPGTSGSPVTWKGTNRVIGIYVGRQEADADSDGTEGLIVSFDTLHVRDSYEELTGRKLATQSLSPTRVSLSAAVVLAKPFGGESSAFGGGIAIGWEQWSWFNWSIGFAGSTTLSRARLDWEYRDPLGQVIDDDSRAITLVGLDFALELQLFRRSWLRPLLGLGARTHWLPELEGPVDLDTFHWSLSGFGRAGLELPVKWLVVRVTADVGYGWIPNTVVRYSGIGSGLRYVGDNDVTHALSVQGAAWFGIPL